MNVQVWLNEERHRGSSWETGVRVDPLATRRWQPKKTLHPAGGRRWTRLAHHIATSDVSTSESPREPRYLSASRIVRRIAANCGDFRCAGTKPRACCSRFNKSFSLRNEFRSCSRAAIVAAVRRLSSSNCAVSRSSFCVVSASLAFTAAKVATVLGRICPLSISTVGDQNAHPDDR